MLIRGAQIVINMNIIGIKVHLYVLHLKKICACLSISQFHVFLVTYSVWSLGDTVSVSECFGENEYYVYS